MTALMIIYSIAIPAAIFATVLLVREFRQSTTLIVN